MSQNLDLAFEHINELIVISESAEYKNKTTQINSFRKTIIVHIATIIEAILQWKYLNIKVLHRINESKEIIAGDRKKIKKTVEKLGLLHLTRLCLKHKIISSEKLCNDIDIVREFRNRLHIGGLEEVDRKYTKQNLEFCFRVTKQVLKAISKK